AHRRRRSARPGTARGSGGHAPVDPQGGHRVSPRRGDGAVTLRTVAERAGVSKSSVSRVLQGSPKVSEEARAAVEAAMAELGYRPNAAAQSLGARRTRTVG